MNVLTLSSLLRRLIFKTFMNYCGLRIRISVKFAKKSFEEPLVGFLCSHAWYIRFLGWLVTRLCWLSWRAVVTSAITCLVQRGVISTSELLVEYFTCVDHRTCPACLYSWSLLHVRQEGWEVARTLKSLKKRQARFPICNAWAFRDSRHAGVAGEGRARLIWVHGCMRNERPEAERLRRWEAYLKSMAGLV